MGVISHAACGLRLVPDHASDSQSGRLLLNPITEEMVPVQSDASLHFTADGWAFLAVPTADAVRSRWVKSLMKKVACWSVDRSQYIHDPELGSTTWGHQLLDKFEDKYIVMRLLGVVCASFATTAHVFAAGRSGQYVWWDLRDFQDCGR